jgi:hypothetical protein
VVKRFVDVGFVYVVFWGVCFLMTVPFGLSDLKFSALFATGLSAVLLALAGLGRFFRLRSGYRRQRRASGVRDEPIRPV